MRPATYAAPAPAKVNLGLAVLTRRGDGFHEIETLMARLELADDVRVEVGAGAPGRVEVATIGEGLPPGDGGAPLPAGAANLAHRAADAYLGAYAHLGAYARAAEGGNGAQPPALPSVRIELTKRIPIAAGLGGGSSDAATVLGLLAKADAAGQPAGAPLVGRAELEALALELGSDVPFFLGSAKAAVARGRGERLTPLDLPPLHLVLVNPGVAVSAADAYAGLVGFTPRLREGRALARLGEGLDPGWSNGLQPGVLRAHPQVREALGALRAAGLKGVLMSGSGATCLGLAASAEGADEAAARLAREHPRWWVRATRTLA